MMLMAASALASTARAGHTPSTELPRWPAFNLTSVEPCLPETADPHKRGIHAYCGDVVYVNRCFSVRTGYMGVLQTMQCGYVPQPLKRDAPEPQFESLR